MASPLKRLSVDSTIFPLKQSSVETLRSSGLTSQDSKGSSSVDISLEELMSAENWNKEVIEEIINCTFIFCLF